MKIKQEQFKTKPIEEEIKIISKVEIIKPVLEKPKVVAQQKKSPAKTENGSKKKL